MSSKTNNNHSVAGGTRNIYYVTAETDDPALYVSPAPYTQSWKLTGLDAVMVLGRMVISGGYLFIFNKRFSLPKFPWQ